MLTTAFDHALYRLLARPVLRHVTGHWPRPPELSAFRRGLREEQDRLPPLLNAFAGTKRLRQSIIETMLAATRTAARTPEGTAAHRLAAGEPIAFMHVEKTAGTSLTGFLERRFSPMLMMPLPPNADEAVARARDPSTRAYTVLHGHFALPFLRTHAPERHVLTILREPAARILSCYYYWRSRQLSLAEDDVNEATVLASRLPLLEFLRCDRPVLLDQIDNVYARRLTGGDVPTGAPVSAACALDVIDRALAGLDSLAFVGITERFPESLDLLGARLGLATPQNPPRINISAQNEADLPGDFRRVPREPVTPAIRAELDRLTRFDRVIYSTARRRFDLAVRSLPTPSRPCASRSRPPD